MTRLEWLLERQKGVSASDMPNLVGVGFRDALAVYRDKTTPPDPEPPRTGVLARGIALEGVVAGRYAEELGTALELPPPLVRHPTMTFLSASPDRLRPDGRPVQLKTTAGFGDGWGPAGTSEVPENYLVQVQQEMGVLGADSCDLAALDVIAWELRVYRVAFDPDLFAWLAGVAERFMIDHLMPRVPPDPGWGRHHAAEVLARVNPGTMLDLGAAAAELVERRKELAAIRDEAGAECDRITDGLKALMGDAERATAGPWRLKRTLIPGGEYTATRKPHVRLDVRAAKPEELK